MIIEPLLYHELDSTAPSSSRRKRKVSGMLRIVSHMPLAGCTNKIFSEETIFAINQSSGGILRRANYLTKTAMMAAAMEDAHNVSPEHVRVATTELIQ